MFLRFEMSCHLVLCFLSLSQRVFLAESNRYLDTKYRELIHNTSHNISSLLNSKITTLLGLYSINLCIKINKI